MAPKAAKAQKRGYDRIIGLIRDEAVCPYGVLPSERDLASLLGVSRTTVRRLLGQLRDEQMISELKGKGWVATDARYAEEPKLNTDTVIAIWPWLWFEESMRNRFKAPGWDYHVKDGITEALGKAGRHIILINSDNAMDKPLSWLGHYHAGGIVIGHPRIHPEVERMVYQCQEHGTRVVISGDTDPDTWSTVYDQIRSDHHHGAYQLTQWLIERGRKRILPLWMINPQHGRPDWLARREAGYQQAMQDAGLEPLNASEGWLRKPLKDPCDEFHFVKQQVTGCLAPVFMKSDIPDAIMLSTDSLVSPTAAAVRSLGRVPNEDVLIAGYDNYYMDLSTYEYEPTRPCATVDKHNNLIGQTMVDLMVDRMLAGVKGKEEPVIRYIRPDLVPVMTEGSGR